MLGSEPGGGLGKWALLLRTHAVHGEVVLLQESTFSLCNS